MMSLKSKFSSLFSSNTCSPEPHESMMFPSFKVNQDIEIKSSHAIVSDEEIKVLRVAPNILHGDTLILFLASETPVRVPSGFKEIMKASDMHGNIFMSCCFTVWKTNDPLEFSCYSPKGETFFNLITINNTRFIVDARARVNSATSQTNEILSPRTMTSKNGAMLTAYAFDEPKGVCIKDQNLLTNINCCGKGLSVGVSSTEGGMSNRVRALANDVHCGGKDDIAMCVSII
jgi:hypothetical protein